MNAKVAEFQGEFANTLKDCEWFCYAARAKELQVESIDKLEVLQDKIAVLKAEMVELKEEDAANCLLSLSLAAKALAYELTMWVALKDDKAAVAWDALVDAEMSALDAVRAHRVSAHLEEYVERLYLLESQLFPPMTFISLGLVIYDSECSICGGEYGQCDHVKGRVYMGQICGRRITRCSIVERSIVPNPANKHARMLACSHGKETRDLLTWRVLPEPISEDNTRRLLGWLGLSTDPSLVDEWVDDVVHNGK